MTNPSPRRGWLTLVLVALALFTVSTVLTSTLLSSSGMEEKTYSEVFTDLSVFDGYEATIDSTGRLRLTPPDAEQDIVVSMVAPDGVDAAVEQLDKAGVDVEVVSPPAPSFFSNLFTALLPVLLIIGFLAYLLTRKGGLSGLGLSKRTSDPVSVPSTTFADVAGAAEAREDLAEIVEFLRDPSRFTAAGARMPHGYLLVGPPGTGKTLLARAVAGEAGVPFYAIAGSDLVEMFVGLGASRVRELFAKARKGGKAIIFIDEIDAIGRARGSGASAAANDEREQTLNSLLVEMDGFSKDDSIVVLAATNRPEILDKALLRPGRFDRKIDVPAPDRGGRAELLALYADGKQLDEGVDLESISRRTPGMTGADIEQLFNEAALEAARQGRTVITVRDMDAALGTSMLGRERKSAVLTEFDRSIVAWHEAGHTVAALRTPGAQLPVTVSIIPRGPAGGATWMEGSDDVFTTRSGSLARLVVAMAGRAAEERLLDGDYTHGAHGDLESATQLATAMVAKLGMGSVLRTIPDEAIFMPGSDEVGIEVQAMISQALDQARDVLERNSALLDAVVEELLVKETLHREDLQVLSARFPGLSLCPACGAALSHAPSESSSEHAPHCTLHVVPAFVE